MLNEELGSEDFKEIKLLLPEAGKNHSWWISGKKKKEKANKRLVIPVILSNYKDHKKRSTASFVANT